MNVSASIRFAAWLLIILNVVMALASIWIFLRMAPAIKVVIEQNSRSIMGAEEMLVAVAMVDIDSANRKRYKQQFEEAIVKVSGNITEEEEAQAIEVIKEQYELAFTDDPDHRRSIVLAIRELADINRTAINRADKQARQIGNGGAWGIVAMAVIVFGTGMLFLRNLQHNLLEPIEEVQAVLHANVTGDLIRRSTVSQAPKDMYEVYRDLNTVLDKAASIQHL